MILVYIVTVAAVVVLSCYLGKDPRMSGVKRRNHELS